MAPPQGPKMAMATAADEAGGSPARAMSTNADEHSGRVATFLQVLTGLPRGHPYRWHSGNLNAQL